jgi:hypothetical protein
MKELDSLEQDMRRWQPRQPPERLARRLFGRAELAPAALRRAEFWHWLTPVAACALTVLVAVGSANHRAEALEGKGGPVIASAWKLDSGWSNAPRMAWLSQSDENVQWNVFPELAPPAGTPFGESSALGEARRASATNLNRN